MPYYVRLMRDVDIFQTAEIDREAFPTEWPLTNFQHELQNRVNHYIVACDEERWNEQFEGKLPSKISSSRFKSGIRRLFIQGRLFDDNELLPLVRHYIIGFAGFWILAEEAHIINVAVRRQYQRQGVGELLFISVIDLAAELNARIVTLEVRVSNTPARNLYRKYGFLEVDIRRGYYLDNNEDAVFMSSSDIGSNSFQARLSRLKQAHSEKHGINAYRIVR